jgi:hypothetical protein
MEFEHCDVSMIQAEKLELAEFKKDEATKRERNRKGKLCLIS